MPNQTEPTAAAAGVLPFHGPDGWAGLVGVCGYDDHRVPLRADGRTAVHEMQRGQLFNCHGSCRPARQNTDEPSSRETAALALEGPRDDYPAAMLRAGDRIRIGTGADARPVTVQDRDFRPPASVVVTFAELPEPVTYDLIQGPRVIHETRPRRHDVTCKLCGVTAAVDVDEVAQGRPYSRVCALCDHQARTGVNVPHTGI